MTITLKRFTIGASAILVGALCLAAGPAMARGQRSGGPGGGRGPGPGPAMGGMGFQPEMLEAVATELGLDARTLTKIKDLTYQTHKTHIGLRSELEAAHLDLKRMMDADSPNIDGVMHQVEKIGAIEIKFRKSQLRLMLTVRGMLTPAQRTRLQQIIQARRANRRGGPGDGPGMGQGRRPGGGPGMGQGRGPGAGVGPARGKRR